MRVFRIAGRILIGVLAGLLLLLVLLHLLVTVLYFDFFNHAKGEFIIPGLDTPFVPQGFDYIPGQGQFLISGYMNDGTASRVYVRESDGDVFCTTLQQTDGGPYTGHAGGICHNGDYVYIAGESGVDVFLLKDVLSGQSARMQGTVNTGYEMAYCGFYNGYLLAGNFYYPGTFETPANHRIVSPAGDSNTGLMTVFAMDSTAQFGINSVPVAAFSTPGQVQGFCFTDDNTIVLSTSYGMHSSTLQFYSVDTSRTSTLEVCGNQVPVFYLDSANKYNQVKLPPMAEELVHRNGRIYILCESASNKYFYGKFIRGYQVFSYDYQDEQVK